MCSGLEANNSKSCIYMGGLADNMKLQLLQTTGFVSRQFSMKYLGIPITSKRWSKVDSQMLVNKITSKADG